VSTREIKLESTLLFGELLNEADEFEFVVSLHTKYHQMRTLVLPCLEQTKQDQHLEGRNSVKQITGILTS